MKIRRGILTEKPRTKYRTIGRTVILHMAALPNQENCPECQDLKYFSMFLRRGVKSWSKIDESLGVSHTPRYLTSEVTQVKGLLFCAHFKAVSGSVIFNASNLEQFILRLDHTSKILSGGTVWRHVGLT